MTSVCWIRVGAGHLAGLGAESASGKLCCFHWIDVRSDFARAFDSISRNMFECSNMTTVVEIQVLLLFIL